MLHKCGAHMLLDHDKHRNWKYVFRNFYNNLTSMWLLDLASRAGYGWVGVLNKHAEP